jgi:predicted metal-dependent HD superfamily phosphohydrolase
MNDLYFFKKKWIKLTSKFTNDLKLIDHYFETIERKYRTYNRYYHNLEHINLMLSKVTKFENRINDYDSVIFAIWFHDIIYDPLKRDNEERSAEFAKEFLIKIKYEKNRIHKVQELILRTKDHTIRNSNDNFDIKVFLDLDLLIMGMKRKHYVKYAKNIRKESMRCFLIVRNVIILIILHK